MRILIIGAGNSGRHLAVMLCGMSHEVVVVDRDPERLSTLDAQLDVMTIAGSGSSPDVLAKGELAKTDLVIAVTDSDEVNLLACMFARAAGVDTTVARVANPALLRTPLLDYKQLGVDCLVSQNQPVTAHHPVCSRLYGGLARSGAKSWTILRHPSVGRLRKNGV